MQLAAETKKVMLPTSTSTDDEYETIPLAALISPAWVLPKEIKVTRESAQKALVNFRNDPIIAVLVPDKGSINVDGGMAVRMSLMAFFRSTPSLEERDKVTIMADSLEKLEGELAKLDFKGSSNVYKLAVFPVGKEKLAKLRELAPKERQTDIYQRFENCGAIIGLAGTIVIPAKEARHASPPIDSDKSKTVRPAASLVM